MVWLKVITLRGIYSTRLHSPNLPRAQSFLSFLRVMQDQHSSVWQYSLNQDVWVIFRISQRWGSWPGLNFINVLRTAFTPVAPKSVRIQSSYQYFFTLLGAMGAKAARRMLMKLKPDACCHVGGWHNGSAETKPLLKRLYQKNLIIYEKSYFMYL